MPKIQEEGVPIRPIVSVDCSPVQYREEYLAKPLFEKALAYVKSLSHFIEILKNNNINNGDRIASLNFKTVWKLHIFHTKQDLKPNRWCTHWIIFVTSHSKRFQDEQILKNCIGEHNHEVTVLEIITALYEK